MLLTTSMDLQPKPAPPSGRTGTVPIPVQSITVLVGLKVVTITIPAYTLTVRVS